MPVSVSVTAPTDVPRPLRQPMITHYLNPNLKQQLVLMEKVIRRRWSVVQKFAFFFRNNLHLDILYLPQTKDDMIPKCIRLSQLGWVSSSVARRRFDLFLFDLFNFLVQFYTSLTLNT